LAARGAQRIHFADQWFAGGGGSGGNHMAAIIGGNVWGLQMAVL
jgi:hypothetical protein